MATTRFVNTASAAGGDGTTNATAGANRAFHSLAEALAPYQGGTLPDHVIINCSGSSPDDGTGGGFSLDHTAWQFLTTATNYLEVFGDNATGKWNTSAYRIEVTNKSAIYNQYTSHVRLYNLQAMVKSTNAGGFNVFRLSTANNGNGVDAASPFFMFKNCIARKDPTSVASDRVDGWSNSICGGGTQAGPLYIINCVAIGMATGSSSGYVDDASGWIVSNAKCYNCVAASCQFGYQLSCVTKNCLATACTFGFISAGAGSNYNAEDDGNGVGGANSRSGTVFTFTNAAGGDYHLVVTDTGAKGFGLTDPSGGVYLDDFEGQVRSIPWDIGADEYQLGGVTTTPASGINAVVQQYMAGTLYIGTASLDLTTNLIRRLAALTGDMTARLKGIIVTAGTKN